LGEWGQKPEKPRISYRVSAIAEMALGLGHEKSLVSCRIAAWMSMGRGRQLQRVKEELQAADFLKLSGGEGGRWGEKLKVEQSLGKSCFRMGDIVVTTIIITTIIISTPT
jgi:hypothetical protein